MSDRVFPLFERDTPVRDLLREKGFLKQRVGTSPETLTEAQKRLAEDFKRGLASAIGVKPEAIRQDLVEKWVVQWSKAVTKPEFWAQGEALGRQLGQVLTQGLPPRGTGLETGRAGERRVGEPRTEEERRERHSTISVAQ